MENLEIRLANTEKALFALWVMMQETMPPVHQDAVDKMMGDYFDANRSLGADFESKFEVAR